MISNFSDLLRLPIPFRKPRDLVLISGLLTIAISSALMFGLAVETSVGAGFLQAALLLVVSLPVFSKQARSEGNRTIFLILILALVVKMVGAVLRFYTAFSIYGGPADASVYHHAGIQVAEILRTGDFGEALRVAQASVAGAESSLGAFTGTYFMPVSTGVIYAVVGANFLGGYIFYSWISFWGLFLFYKAFIIALGENKRSYSVLVFFLPSLFFWPSSIGKDSLMVFGLGLSAYGASRALEERSWLGAPTASLGIIFCAVVRTHVAAMVGGALVLAYLVRKPSRKLRELAPVSKIAMAILLFLVGALMIREAQQYLEMSDIDTGGGLLASITGAAERLSVAEGGSDFIPTPLVSAQAAPAAAFTVLFRPHLFEATSPPTLFAATEGAVLLVLTIVRLRSLGSALLLVRAKPYLLFLFSYVGAFIVGFSTLGNFGILARQRVQLLPFFLMLLCFSPRSDSSSRGDVEHSVAQAVSND